MNDIIYNNVAVFINTNYIYLVLVNIVNITKYGYKQSELIQCEVVPFSGTTYFSCSLMH